MSAVMLPVGHVVGHLRNIAAPNASVYLSAGPVGDPAILVVRVVLVECARSFRESLAHDPPNSAQPASIKY